MLKESSFPSPEIKSDLTASWTPESFEDSRLQTFIRELTPSEEVRQGRRFGVHVINGQEPHSDIGRHIEHTVFHKNFGNDLETLKKEYGAYDAASTFLTVLDYENAAPAAVIRVIGPSEAGLKSMHDLVDAATSPWQRENDSLESRWQEIGNQPEHTVDILTMAVMSGYGSNHAFDGASAALYSTCVRWSLANGYNRWVSIMHADSEGSIYQMIQSWGEPFINFDGAEPASYLGSKASLPVHTELHGGLEKIRQFDQKMTEMHGQTMDVHGLYTRGAGLEGQFVLPNFSDTVQ